MKTVTAVAIASSGVGATIGIVGGYFLTRKKFQAQADADILDVKLHYQDQLRTKIAQAYEDAEVLKSEPDITREDLEDNRTAFQQELIGQARVEGKNYTNYSRNLQDHLPVDLQHIRANDYGGESLIDQSEKDRVETTISQREDRYEPPADLLIPTIIDKELPFVVTYDQFMDTEYEHLDKTTLVYYAEDNTLVDERDQPIPDIAGVVGVEALDAWGTNASENTVYVRNLKHETDYEIVRDPRGYAEVVLGAGPPAMRGRRADD